MKEIFSCEVCDADGRWGRHASDCSKKPDLDMINEPPHYRGVNVVGVVRIDGRVVDSREVEIEAIDVIEGLGLGYHLGTVLKYLWRAGKKGSRVEDLKKARWFLDREIKKAGK